MPYHFDFQTFSSSMTSYFLPYLALAAQLPYETGDPWQNIMAFCLAVGSPALIAYSLTITILNRMWTRRQFDILRDKAESETLASFPGFRATIGSAQYLLQEAQQVPLRASQERGWFSSLIVFQGNANVKGNALWWAKLEKRLKSTRRGVTASLVAQVALAVIAYLFTVIASFMAQLGDPATALQISSSTLWLWLIPIVLGYISCGTQATDHSIEDALSKAHERAYCAPEPPHTEPTKGDQQGLMVRSGISPQLLPNAAQTQSCFNTPNALRLEIPPWMGASIGGDEELKGPIFNYARLFTWSQLAHTFESAFAETLQNITDRRLCTDNEPSAPLAQNLGPHGLTADSRGTARYCGIGTQGIRAYAKWSSMSAEVYRRIIGASCAAIFLQWGTTGASVIIAYTTPTVGLGCRSGGYLLYGGFATLAWLCLVMATFFSHAAMLRYQSEHILDPFKQFQRDPSYHLTNNPGQQQNVYERDLGHSALCGAAVLFRYLGKTLCVLNTFLLIISSLMEVTGGYNNCWCQGIAFGMGRRGWVVLFESSADLAAAAWLPWVGGLVMTIVVCVASYGFFWLGSSKS
ncbi:hypothetical protein B0A48_02688 [Cryoendolithus antarcticus]|uniref:Uncharacterized protein n=1 Tax=Cryoendolithus antarcticus TaxID=1507870 RepID=A0A1V8TKZ3_9PEZI|nr:hypothetical protein B0A48_02688 [Cryoendolithus antarcticus]